jgi:hypothetical protein
MVIVQGGVMRIWLTALLFASMLDLGLAQGYKGEVNRYLPNPKGDAWLDLMTGKIYRVSDEVKPSGPVIWSADLIIHSI